MMLLKKQDDDTVIIDLVEQEQSFQLDLSAVSCFLKQYTKDFERLLDFLWNFKSMIFWPESGIYYVQDPQRLTGIGREITGRIIPFSGNSHNRKG